MQKNGSALEQFDRLDVKKNINLYTKNYFNCDLYGLKNSEVDGYRH